MLYTYIEDKDNSDYYDIWHVLSIAFTRNKIGHLDPNIWDS